MRLSVVGLGGLLARYEGFCGHPPPEEKQRIYRRAAELGINLFDMGYGDEVHIPEELRGEADDRYFCLKAHPPTADDLEAIIDTHLANLRRGALDVLRVHHTDYVGKEGLAERIADLKQSGKVRSLCLIRHYQADQEAYAEGGPEPEADADLVVYNYVRRAQEPGIQRAAASGKGVLIMKALGGQWLDWEKQTRVDWSVADEATVEQLSPEGEHLRGYVDLILPIVKGPWQKLAGPGEPFPPTGRAVSWVLDNQAVSSVLVAFASVSELEETIV